MGSDFGFWIDRGREKEPWEMESQSEVQSKQFLQTTLHGKVETLVGLFWI